MGDQTAHQEPPEGAAYWPLLGDDDAFALLSHVPVNSDDVDTLLGNLELLLSVRGRATVVLALLLRSRYSLPLIGAIAVARDVLEREAESTCEALTGVARSGWHGGVWALLETARTL
jgi:hypothetical protein